MSSNGLILHSNSNNCLIEAESSREALINGSNQLATGPLIIGLKSNYLLGQDLDVNCTLPQMIDGNIKPRLDWFIHNEKVGIK